MRDQDDTAPNTVVPLLMIAANVAGILIGYAITILLARNLSKPGFEQYIGAIATLGLLASLGEAGFGKYGLQVVPVYIENRKRSLLAGYLRFSLYGTLALSLLLGLIAIAIELPIRAGSEERVILLAILYLPAMAGFGVAIDLLLAFRMAAIGTLIARILVPLTTLGLICWMIQVEVVTPYRAVLCFGIGSFTGLLVALRLCNRMASRMTENVTPQLRIGQWTGHGVWFLTLGFLTAWIFKATLVLTHHLPHSGDELAILAPAFETGCLILLLSKSTDKYFQPMMALMLESRDWAFGLAMRRTRTIVVGCGVATFLAIVFLFGPHILGLYGDDFVLGYPSLCLIAVGSSIWTSSSLAPTFLLFAGERRLLLASLSFHALLMAVLTVWLFNDHGATGAAAAYAISVSSMALANVILANRRFGRMRPAAQRTVTPGSHSEIARSEADEM